MNKDIVKRTHARARSLNVKDDCSSRRPFRGSRSSRGTRVSQRFRIQPDLAAGAGAWSEVVFTANMPVARVSR